MWTLPLLIVVPTVLLSIPVGLYLAWIMDGRYRAPRWLRWFEGRLDTGPQNWKQYTVALLLFNTVMFVVGFAIQQHVDETAEPERVSRLRDYYRSLDSRIYPATTTVADELPGATIDEEKYITGMFPRPDVRREVHHVIIAAVKPEAIANVQKLEDADPLPGFDCNGSLGDLKGVQVLGGSVQGGDFPRGLGTKVATA